MFLPNPGGRFPVGATTFKLPIPQHTVISSVRVRSGPSSEMKHALVLEEVAFTAYYPADVPSKSVPRGLNWLLRPLRASLQGYSNYSGFSLWLLWPVVYLFGSLLRVPVHPEAPLLNPHNVQTESSKSSPWPLVIFSHGLGGSRMAYSQLCSRIASSGRVVLAMEHRDGSGHAAVPSFSDPIPYLKETKLVWPPERPAEQCNMLSFRGEQLEFRRMEIYHVFRAIQSLVRDGRNDTRYPLEAIGDTRIDWSRWSTVESRKPIECEENVVLAGHSFGAATVLSILSNAPPENELTVPVQKALILDPWLEPLPSPGPIPRQRFNEEPLPKILVINSEKFTLWKGHFERLMEVGKSWTEGGWELLTIVRSEHASFSDFLVLPLVSSKAARLILDKISHLSLAFLDDDGGSVNAGLMTRRMEIRVVGQRADGRPKRQIVGNLSDVILH